MWICVRSRVRKKKKIEATRKQHEKRIFLTLVQNGNTYARIQMEQLNWRYNYLGLKSLLLTSDEFPVRFRRFEEPRVRFSGVQGQACALANTAEQSADVYAEPSAMSQTLHAKQKGGMKKGLVT